MRATSSQRCVRAGGKHNDLENVGYTARHHTFFEMLGNFSFGDYFKKDAIRFAWDFVTGTLKIDPARLMVTVYATDDEAFDLWHKEAGVPKDKIVRIGDKPGGGSDNFWQMGETGPCGPCTEIFFDHGAHIPGGPPGSPDADGDRWVEIWNLVFMQFDRSADGKLTPLPKPSVDTGAGLERVSAVMQGVTNNYDIDLFKNLVKAAAALANTNDLTNSSLRVIADHIRACTFLVIDGVTPSNEGRGYVLRRIIRRAIRHGYKLGIKDAFFYKLVDTLAAEMGGAFPELATGKALAARVLKQEEERFAETLANGMQLLDGAFAALKGGKTLDGETVFKLYDTYGFPVDLTADIARERGFSIDHAGYEAAMEVQRKQSQAASKFGMDMSGGVRLEDKTDFLGYEATTDVGKVVALLKGGAAVQALECRRRRRSGARSHAFLCGVRRPGGRRGRARQCEREVHGGRHAEARRRVFAYRQADRGRRSRSATASRRMSMRRAARPSWPTIRPLIYYMPPCARCWARMFSRRARWWRPTGCASTSRISRRSRPTSSRRSSGW